MLKTMLLAALVLVAVVIAAVLAIAATKPGDFSIRRSVHIDAPAGKVFSYLNDFHQWALWSPWDRLDPAMQRTYGGPAAGQGATYAWSGTGKVGAGRMEIREAAAPSKVSIQLDFLKPFEGHNVTDFSLAAVAGGTDVTWLMHGPSAFATKVMSVFVDMDKLIGKDFEARLANLKAAAEK